MRGFVKFLCLLFTLIYASDGAKILGIVHMPAYSHFQLGDRIFRELASKGHEVTVITPYELKEPVKNLKHVVITGFLQEIEAIKKDLFDKKVDVNIANKIVTIDMMSVLFTERTLQNENVQTLLKSNEKFDLVIYENFVNEAFSGFSYYYKAPYVILSTVGPSRWTNSKMGNPDNPSYIPDIMLSFSSSMNFWERVYNTLVYFGAEAFHLYTIRKQNELLQKYFPGAPHLSDLMYNASLLLLNSHPSIGAAVPLVPNMIEIGGYHVKPAKPLPKDLQEYFDNAKEGVVYFSMGSNMKSTNMPAEKRDAILRSLGKLKQQVLWKWETDVLPGQPPNVKLAKWLPQQDILAHPNLKLFVTHGGLLSTIEAIYHGVPVLGLPVFGDQEMNIGQATNLGYGFGVRYLDITESRLSAALDEILTNKKYAENAKHRSKILHDQQTKPLDRAIYWLEYVIRHQGAPHLRTAALNLAWYQYLLLDVIALIIAIFATVLWILCKITKLVCGKKVKKVVPKDKKRN